MWSEGPWGQFINEHVVPLHSLSNKLLNFHSWLSGLGNRRIIEGIETWPGLEVALLGGTRTTGEYEEGSIALIYRKLLGLNANIREYYAYLEQRRYGIEPETTFTVQATPFLLFLKRVKTVTEKILDRSKERGWNISSAKASFQDLQEDPARLVLTVVDLLNRCRDVTVNASEFTLAAWSLWGLTKSYIEGIYPEAKDPAKFSWLCDILGLEPIFVPDLPKEDLKAAYTVYGYPHLARKYEWGSYSWVSRRGNTHSSYYPCASSLPFHRFCPKRRCNVSGCYEGEYSYCDSMECVASLLTLGEGLCALNLLVWQAFTEHEKLGFGLVASEVLDLHVEYVKQVKGSLEQFEKPRLASALRGDLEWLYDYEIEISGPLLKNYVHHASYNSRETSDLSLPLIPCLEELMPFIYVGIIKPVFSRSRFVLLSFSKAF